MSAAFQKSSTPAVWAGMREESGKIDLSDLLPRVKAATLVIHETLFPFVAVELCRSVAAGIPGARLFSAADCGAEVDKIDAFLQAASPEARPGHENPKAATSPIGLST